MNPFLQSSLTSFTASSDSKTKIDDPMTEEEQNFLLNDSIVRMPTPKQTVQSNAKSMKNKELVPLSLVLFKKIGGKESGKPLRVLFDSGGGKTMIHSRALPPDATVKIDKNVKPCTTVSGTYNANRSVKLRDGIFPEFDKHRRIYGLTATVFDEKTCPYDIIIGRDLLKDLGIIIDFTNHHVKWMENFIFMKPRTHFQHHTNYTAVFSKTVYDIFDEIDDAFILDAKYEATTPKEVADQQHHLTSQQKLLLQEALKDTAELFDGALGRYKGEKVHLDLIPGSQPVHAKAYSVPTKLEPAFLKELDHLRQIGVLEIARTSLWASPTFVIPKKDGRIRWISDLRELNKCLQRKVYPLPLIEDIVRRRKGYKYFTKLDLTMMYYSFELDDKSADLCTIVTPYGKYKYRRMAMGLKPAPDIAQSNIEHVLQGLKKNGVEAYIDDIGIFSNSYDEHMKTIKEVVQRLQQSGFKVNPLKCEWCIQETDFLGHWMTPSGIKPWKKKIDAVLKMSKPTNTTQLRSFLGAVTYYRNMWPRRSHLLHPLTQLTGKGKKQPILSQWTPECDRAFDEMKALMASDVLMRYPNPDLPFDIYTDASDLQMGAVIMQKGKPVAYWSRKLNSAQKNYSVMEKEMLSIVHCLKEFRSMLFGQQINVYTDHKNLTFRTLNTQRVLRWRMYMEEYSPNFYYIEGKLNIIADCFSRLPRMEKPSEGKSTVGNRGKLIAFDKLDVKIDPDDEMFNFEADVLTPPPTEAEFNKTHRCKFSCCRDAELSELDLFDGDQELLDAFLNHPPLEVMANPITMANIQHHQTQDQELMQRAEDQPLRYPVRQVDETQVITYCTDPYNYPNAWRIYIPVALVNRIIQWYHLVLGHRGQGSMYKTISRRFYSPGLKSKIEAFNCEVCQKNKPANISYGHLPERNAVLIPWHSVSVDLIGPWKIKVNGIDVVFNALTCIDPVTNLAELTSIENKTAEHVAATFQNLWLARYPKPMKCVHDNGGEFRGQAFQEKLAQWGIADAPTTSKNPMANAICERMHLVVANILRTRFNNPNAAPDAQAAQQVIDDALASCNHAMRCAVSTALMNNTPGEMVFGRDMLLNIPVLIDLAAIQDNRQLKINENLRRQNSKRREFDYSINDEVLIKVPNPNKLEPRFQGPFRITQVFTNGTVEIQRTNQVYERINIRRLIPFRRV